MRLWLFHLFSFIEWSSMCVFALAIFRFKIREHAVFIVGAAICISAFSYIIRELLGWVVISPLLQLVALVVICKFSLRLPFVYAGIIVTFAYSACVSWQAVLFLLADRMMFFSIDKELLQLHQLTYLMQVVTGSFVFLGAFILVRFRLGFTVVPGRGIKENAPYVILAMLTGGTCSLALLFINYASLQVLFAMLTAILFYLLHLLIAKERDAVRQRKADGINIEQTCEKI